MLALATAVATAGSQQMEGRWLYSPAGGPWGQVPDLLRSQVSSAFITGRQHSPSGLVPQLLPPTATDSHPEKLGSELDAYRALDPSTMSTQEELAPCVLPLWEFHLGS